MWELEDDPGGSDDDCVLIKSTQVKGVSNVYTAEEAASYIDGGQRAEGEVSTGGGKYVVMGFVVRKIIESEEGKRRRRGSGAAAGTYVVSRTQWAREGTPDDPKFSIRKPGFIHNINNAPVVMTPLVAYTDAFNSCGMSVKSSVGGTYISLATSSLALQRRRGQANITTVASKGASSQGEMDLYCRVMGELEQGCYAVIQMPAFEGQEAQAVKVFLRGGLLLLVADSPQRALMCFVKHPNIFSRFPCVYCMVEHNTKEAEGGDLGNQLFDVVAHRRTRGLMMEGRKRLESLAFNPKQQETVSTELGIVEPKPGDVWHLFDVMDIVPSAATPAESLHADALCGQALVQRYGIILLNPAGREVMAAIMRQRDGNSLYPSGEAPLKDIINDYSSLSGGDKWLLASIFLLAFRPVIQSMKSLVS
ncbi:unnamed protein product, partial [Scytosiphon promiscuus]